METNKELQTNVVVIEDASVIAEKFNATIEEQNTAVVEETINNEIKSVKKKISRTKDDGSEFKKLCHQMEEIFIKYLKNYEVNRELNDGSFDERFDRTVAFALKRMDPDGANLLRTEYIFQKKNVWETLNMSKATYYRVKKVAMTEFLNLLK